jgi:alpha-L-fucosidase 2
LLSLYDPGSSDPIFQYDANGAYPGAVMVSVSSKSETQTIGPIANRYSCDQNALIQAPDVATLQSTLVVTLLPALPSTWSTGSLTGARVRGGIRADLAWSKGNITRATLTFDRARLSRPVEIIYRGQVLNTVTAQPGQVLDLL